MRTQILNTITELSSRSIKMSDKSEPRKVGDLKVTELRSELEKRDLDKTGVKAILLERLQKVSV